MLSGAISSQPACSKEAWCSPCRIARVPMKTPRSRLRSTAYHMVDASLGPWMRSQGRGGSPSSEAIPDLISWRWVEISPLAVSMKNTPMTVEPSPAWIHALDLLDADLRRRNAAPRTRMAYRTDLVALAAWATAQGIEPADIDHRTLRRHAATLSESGNGATTVARK